MPLTQVSAFGITASPANEFYGPRRNLGMRQRLQGFGIWLVLTASVGCHQMPWHLDPSEKRALAEYVYPRHVEQSRFVEGPVGSMPLSTSVQAKGEAKVQGVGEEFVKPAPRTLPQPPTPVAVNVADVPPKLPMAETPTDIEIGTGKPEANSNSVVVTAELPVPASPEPLPTSVTSPPALPAAPTIVPIVQVRNDEPAKKVPLVEALRCVLDDRPQEALQHLQAYDPETQEICLQFLPTLTMFAKKRVDQFTSQDVAVLNDQLHGMLAKLRPRTELAIDAICFCEWVKGYGIYQPVPRNYSFQAESPDKPGDFVQLYVEIRSFACEPTKDEGFFETRLSSSIEIRKPKGDKVWHHDFKDPPRRTRAQLHDYCNNYCFSVPPLEPGIYQLELQVVDETMKEVRRVARKTIEFRIAASAGRQIPR